MSEDMKDTVGSDGPVAIHCQADTVAVIVTYNRKNLLAQCIEAVLQQTKSCDLLIIDNASTDGTGEFLKTLTDPRIHCCNTGRNLGGAGGFHYGMKTAVEAGYDYLWIMDDDTIAKPDALAKFFEAEKQLPEEYGWLSGQALWTDETPCLMNQQRKSPYKKLQCNLQEITPIQIATFVSLFLKADVVIAHGLPCREFFIWGDDWEYTRRISRKHSCYFIPQSVVIHAMVENSPNHISNTPQNRIDRFFYAFRNEWVMFRKEGIFGWGYYFAKCTLNFWKIIFKAPDQRWKRLKCLLKGAFAGMFFFPKIEYVTHKKDRQL